MSLFPFNANVARTAQTDAPSIHAKLLSLLYLDLGSPAATDDDYYVAAATDMKVGVYTLLHTKPDVGARNVLVTHTATDAADTLGKITVTGTDLADNAITEDITPVSGTTAAGTKAFKTISKIEGSGWVTNGGADKIKVGFADVIGLPEKVGINIVVAAYLGGVREATAATVKFSATVLAENTVDLNSAMNGSKVEVVYAT